MESQFFNFFADKSFIHINKFIPESKINLFLKEIEEKKDLTFKTTLEVNVNSNLEKDASGKSEIYSAGSIISYNDLGSESEIFNYYHNADLLTFIKNTTGENCLLPYDIPFGAINVAIMKYGEYINEHFDFCTITGIIMLKTVTQGGVLYLYDNNGSKIQFDTFLPGDLILLKGNLLKHAVSKICCNEERITLLFAWVNDPNIKCSEEIRLLRYGKI